MRLFVALDLPAGVGFPVPDAPWRAVPRDKQHVTLVFLGEAEPDAVALTPPPRAPLVADRLMRLGRVLAVALRDPTGAHTAYQRTLAAALDRVEGRPWLPHVTIGRARERVRGRLPQIDRLEFVAPSATLYRSAGGCYEPLARELAQS